MEEKLLAGLSIVVEPNICLSTPLTLREMAAIGFDDYYKNINLITLSEGDVQDICTKLNIEMVPDVQITGYDFIVRNCLQNHIFYDEFKAAMMMIINERISVIEQGDEYFIIIGEPSKKRILDNKTFIEFQNIVRAQNNMEVHLPLTDFEKKMKEKFDKKRKLVDETKEKEGKDKDSSDLSLSDLISVLAASGNGLNILNVWDLTLYSFHDQFKRMQMIEEYRDGISLICAGADPKKIKLKHYIRKILDTK